MSATAPLDLPEEFDARRVIIFIRRQLNILKEGELLSRKSAISEVKRAIEKYKIDMDETEYEEIMSEFSKTIIQCFSDPAEKVRESSVQVYVELWGRCKNVEKYLPYAVEALTNRLNCRDLEGVEGLDPRMVPTPSQKPQKMARLAEESEVVREELLKLAQTLVDILSADTLRPFTEDFISILSVLLMDPAPQIQLLACKLASEFFTNFKELVYHFCGKLARALLLPLTSKRSNIKIAAIQSLHDLMFCGTWKYTVEIFDILVGYKDPNYVPIKDFYEPSHNLNYFASLITSPNPSVREAFLQMMGDLIVSLPDKVDVETRLIPYFLSGLFDEFEEIRDHTMGLIEEVGLAYEREKEKDLREIKQLGVMPEWSYHGKLLNLPLPHPFKSRPRLGARCTVRNHFYKLVIPITRELKDRIGIQGRLRALKLLE
jgi:hypothetical protein